MNVTLVEPNNEYLTINDDPEGVMVREKADLPDGEEVTALTSVHGSPGFSSGQQGYWEVRLGDENVGIKKSWWVGVTVPSASYSSLFLASKGDEISVNTKTGDRQVVAVTYRPEILGVYLNYDMGQLSFYDAVTQKHIVTLVTKFPKEVVPFFNPGKGDMATMTILHEED